MPQETQVTAKFDVPGEIIFKTLTEQIQICQFTRCLAVSEPQPGGKLEMFDGNIQGQYVEIEENTKIVMKWKFKDWDDFADLVISINNVNDSCELTLDYTNIPEYDSHKNFVHLDKIGDGWKQNIFKMIHMVFGYHYRDE